MLFRAILTLECPDSIVQRLMTSLGGVEKLIGPPPHHEHQQMLALLAIALGPMQKGVLGHLPRGHDIREAACQTLQLTTDRSAIRVQLRLELDRELDVAPPSGD